MKQKLIIGLGNPGSKYEKTRHNAGFIILDALAREYGVGFEFKKKLKSEIAKLPDLILAKPQTFMNESGGAVSLIAKTYKLTPDSLLVVHDEIDLPLGQIRSSSGGSAGHKGVESIIAALGSGVSHLRIGIENRKEYRIPPTDDYVLQNFTKEENAKLKKEIIPQAINEIKKFLIGN